jgi:IS5 family transposase
MLRAIERLGALARTHGLTLCQSFVRVVRRARREGRASPARARSPPGTAPSAPPADLPRPADPDIGRKIAGNPEPGEAEKAAFRWKDAPPDAFAETVARATQIHAQKAGDRDKIYAFHAPEVECIGKVSRRALGRRLQPAPTAFGPGIRHPGSLCRPTHRNGPPAPRT